MGGNIDVKSLAATIGAIFLLLLSATTVVIGVYKSVKEAFSDNYKKC